VSVAAPVAERPNTRAWILGTLLFIAMAIVGLYIVKWSPYWGKAHIAAATHSIGPSIVSGTSAAPPAAGWSAALQYAIAYFNAVWTAVVLALLLGASIQVFVPRKWLLQLVGAANARSAAIAGAISLAGMMCTCCTAPIVVGMRKQRTSIEGALAFFLGNPLLNPAVLIFMGFVLGWQFAAIRLVSAVLLIAVVVAVAHHLGAALPSNEVEAPSFELAPIEQPNANLRTLSVAWLKEMWNEIVAILPGYIVIVFLLGAARAFLFPPGLTLHTNGIIPTALVALVGTLFVVPTAGEVPIVQTLLAHGMSIGAAIALIITLPAISLPSLFIVRKVFPPKVLATTFGIIFVGGVLIGSIASLFVH